MLKKIVIFVMLAVAISLLLVDTYDDEFSTSVWHNQPSQRYRMVNSMIEGKWCIGKSKSELVSLLGASDFQYLGTTEHLAYRIGKPPSFYKSEPQVLLITFTNNRAVRVSRINPKDKE